MSRIYCKWVSGSTALIWTWKLLFLFQSWLAYYDPFLISNLRSIFVRKLITSFDKYDQGLEKYHNNQKSKF